MIRIINTYCEHKTIDYLGSTLIVPHWTKYISTDKLGKVYAFNKEPYYENGSWLNSNPDYPAEHIANAQLHINHKNSMVKL